MGRRQLQRGAKIRRGPRRGPRRSLQVVQCWECDRWHQGWRPVRQHRNASPRRFCSPAHAREYLAARGYGGAAAPVQVVSMPGVREGAAGAGRSGLLQRGLSRQGMAHAATRGGRSPSPHGRRGLGAGHPQSRAPRLAAGPSAWRASRHRGATFDAWGAAGRLLGGPGPRNGHNSRRRPPHTPRGWRPGTTAAPGWRQTWHAWPCGIPSGGDAQNRPSMAPDAPWRHRPGSFRGHGVSWARRGLVRRLDPCDANTMPPKDRDTRPTMRLGSWLRRRRDRSLRLDDGPQRQGGARRRPLQGRAATLPAPPSRTP